MSLMLSRGRVESSKREGGSCAGRGLQANLRRLIILSAFLVLLAPLASGAPVASAARPHATIQLSRLLRMANLTVRSRYPGAQFHVASGTPTGGSGKTAASVQHWTFLFAVAKSTSCRASSGTVTIEYKSGAFSQPLIVCQPLLNSVKIRLPLHRSLRTAIRLLHEAGYTVPFASVSVYYPVSPTIHEPFYVFALTQHQGAVNVGINSGRVTTSP